jgi:alanine transaminase
MSTFSWPSSSTINSKILRAEYAVRGRILNRAEEIQREMKAGASLPFDEFIACNIGNPQALRQQPISFLRQVLSAALNPALLDAGVLPEDAVNRARAYLDTIPNMGAYSNSQGIERVREEVAQFIERRDGLPSDPSNIFLTNGASEGVRMNMDLLLRTNNDGLLVPIPQYPLYSALSTLLDGKFVGYSLEEDALWGVDLDKLRATIEGELANGTELRGMVVINPGNPTGQVLTPDVMRGIVQICHEYKLVLMADEVYQENIYNHQQGDGQTVKQPFHSFKSIVYGMNLQEDFRLVSFHSTSKGFLGECGLRGGYFELTGFDPDVKALLYKYASISLCPNTTGQIATGLMVNPPSLDNGCSSETVAQYEGERDGIMQSLERRANVLSAFFDSLPHMTCNPIQGAMYAFPQIHLPDSFVEEANQHQVPADEYYCLKLLEATGIIVVPGSGFGQEEGTWHFRTTFLPPEDKMDAVMDRMRTFHVNLLESFGVSDL